jgi:general secretion pathway protein E
MNQLVAVGKSEIYEEISDYLVQNNKLKESDLLKVNQLREQISAGLLPALLMKEQAGGDGLPALLIKLSVCSEKNVAEAIAQVSDKELATVDEYPEDPPLEDKVSARFFKEYRVVVIQENMGEVVVAIVDPTEIFAIDALQLACKKKIRVRIGVLSEIDMAIEKQFGSGKSLMGQIIENLEVDDVSDDDIEQLKDLASEAPVIRIVNLIMQRALEYRASDVHIEPFEQQLNIRLRVDGVLQDMEAPPVTSTAAVISRIKIMAKLNIAERRLPQDGRIKTQVQGKELDLRVSTIPTMHGESIVIRILDKENIVLDFKRLGFSEKNLVRFQNLLSLPHGIILITGPTGSGKTTTLYTAINQLNTNERKIITVEDPVEYQLSGINQVQVMPKIGLDFAKALRSIVRQDPDVIMIGEMRDMETATIAVQSALTGHQVLSTLHTNDAVGGVTRLLDMGLEDYLLTSTINGILAQRLVRRLCEHCRRSYPASPEVIEELRLRKLVPKGSITLYEPIGCDECSNIGFFGRIIILELMQMTDQMRKLIMSHENSSKLMAAALDDGMQTMFVDGLNKALDGQTTIDEVLRVTSDS